VSSNSAIAPQATGTDLIRELQEAFNEASSLGHQKRTSPRFPLNFSMKLFPVSGRGKHLLFTPMEIVGRDISATGIGFSHQNELAHKRVIIYFYRPGAAKFAFEAQIVWTAPMLDGGYESGCTLVRKLHPSEIVGKL
jgi:PilZ domain-containing protein